MCAQGEIGNPPPRHHILRMNYLLALLLPPLSIFLAGRPILGIVTFVVWVVALIVTLFAAHPVFVILAWIIIFERNRDRSFRQ